MQNGHPDVQEDIIAVLVLQDGLQTLPAMEVEILLKEMVKTTVTADLELRPNSETSASFLGSDNALDDA